MKLQILSNTVLEGRDNKTNNFEMKLIQPIDGLIILLLSTFWKYVVIPLLKMSVKKIVGLFYKNFMRI